MRDEPQRGKAQKRLFVGVRKLTPTYGERRGRQISEFLPSLWSVGARVAWEPEYKDNDLFRLLMRRSCLVGLRPSLPSDADGGG